MTRTSYFNMQIEIVQLVAFKLFYNYFAMMNYCRMTLYIAMPLHDILITMLRIVQLITHGKHNSTIAVYTSIKVRMKVVSGDFTTEKNVYMKIRY